MSKSVGLMMWGFTIKQSLGDAFAKRICTSASVVRHPINLAVKDFGVGLLS